MRTNAVLKIGAAVLVVGLAAGVWCSADAVAATDWLEEGRRILNPDTQRDPNARDRDVYRDPNDRRYDERRYDERDRMGGTGRDDDGYRRYGREGDVDRRYDRDRDQRDRPLDDRYDRDRMGGTSPDERDRDTGRLDPSRPWLNPDRGGLPR